MNKITLEQVLHRLHNLPSLPRVVMELLTSTEQDNVNNHALAQKIGQDQALAAKTLRLANSSFYGVSRQVGSIEEAITILGFRTVRSLAATAALIDTFAGSSCTGFDFAPFWRHAIAVAVCARELATHLKIDSENAYTVGLLHDIGRLVLVTQFQSQYEATMRYRSQHDCHLVEAERAVLGLDHTAVGQALARQWKFPETMQQTLAEHHAPSSLGLSKLSQVVMAADAIAHALDLSVDENDLVPTLPTGLWPQLGLDEKTLQQVFENTELQFQGVSLVLNA